MEAVDKINKRILKDAQKEADSLMAEAKKEVANAKTAAKAAVDAKAKKMREEAE